MSCRPDIEGYIHNTTDRFLRSIGAITGSPPVHFLEDTFSGPIASPNILVESDQGVLVPDTLNSFYPEEIASKRRVALQAIVDFASQVTTKPGEYDPAAVERMDTFLADPRNYRHLMVPHE